MAKTALKLKETGPELISIAEIARRCGIHKTTVSARLDELGYEPDDSSNATHKYYPFDDEMMFAIKTAKDSASAAKLRDLRATYELKELKLAEARKELVPMMEVVELSQKLHATVYKEIAVNQPKRLATRLAKAKTAAEVTKIMKLEAEKFLKRLREDIEG